MRKMKATLLAAVCCLMMTSCYTASVYHGKAVPGEAYVKVNSVKNHHLIVGLVPVGKTKLKAEDYMKERESYVVKHQLTFLDGFLGCITGGLYTPSTTTFYVPLDSVAVGK